MESLQTELVIIGAGLAAMAAALTIQEKCNDIVLIDKGKIFSSGSTFRNRNHCWGITYACNDNEKDLLYSTIQKISKGTNTASLSRILVEESYHAFQRLKKWGIAFQHDTRGEVKRIRPCFGTQPLASIISSTDQVRSSLAERLDRSRIRLLQETSAASLLVEGDKITGLVAQTGGREMKIACQAVILACGGGAATFARHIVDPGLVGDGYKLLGAIGVPLQNMQYHQSVWEDISLDAPRFQLGYFADGNHLFFDANGNEIHLPPPTSPLTKSRLGHAPISNLQADRKFDAPLLAAAEKSPITVVRKSTNSIINKILPHCQACNGGVLVTEHGETPIHGLFAAGEITTGMHGGDRIGGMMIANCLVFGQRAATAAVSHLA